MFYNFILFELLNLMIIIYYKVLFSMRYELMFKYKNVS